MPTSSGDGCYEHCPVASALLTPTKSADDSHMPPPFAVRCSPELAAEVAPEQRETLLFNVDRARHVR